MSDNKNVPERLHIPLAALAQWHEKSPCLPAFEPVCVGDPHKVYVLETANDKYVPGMWRCAKCDFLLIQPTLEAETGIVFARDATGERCPNCGTALLRVSWEERANEMAQRLNETWAELYALKKRTFEQSPKPQSIAGEDN